MRIDRFLIVLIGLFLACKGTKTTQSTSAGYREDLSIHRLPSEALPDSQRVRINEVVTAEPVILDGHIKPELDSINRIIVEQNTARPVDGFEIQVYNGNSRQDAREVLDRIREMYPELEPYMSYHQPNYRVKAGRFFDRLVATRTYEEIKGHFPRALLIPGRYLPGNE